MAVIEIGNVSLNVSNKTLSTSELYDLRIVGINFCLSILNIFLHGFGSFLLLKTYKWRNMTTQQMIILHISIGELFSNIAWLLIHIFAYFSYGRDTPYFGYCFSVVISLKTVLYFLMMLMTLDRLMATVLNFKYLVLWDPAKTRKTLHIIWCIGILSVIFHVVSYTWKKSSYQNSIVFSFWVYSAVVASLLYIVVAVVTYTVIFLKYKHSREAARQYVPRKQIQQISLIRVFLNSRFFVSLLIILTYLFFRATPNLIYTLYQLVYREKSLGFSYAVRVMLHLGYTSDAMIYIFLQRNVRRNLFNMITRTQDISTRIERETDF